MKNKVRTEKANPKRKPLIKSKKERDNTLWRLIITIALGVLTITSIINQWYEPLRWALGVAAIAMLLYHNIKTYK